MKQGNKRYKTWCYGCDAQIVSGGKKCANCGSRMPNKKTPETLRGKETYEKHSHETIS